MALDGSARVRQSQFPMNAHAQLANLLADAVADILMLVDAEGVVLVGNTRVTELLKKSPAGLHLSVLIGDQAFGEIWGKCQSEAGAVTAFEAPLLFNHEEPIGYLWALTPAPEGRFAISGRAMTHVYAVDLVGRLAADLTERQRRLEVVSEINRALARALDIEQIDALIAREIKRIIPVDMVEVTIGSSSDELMAMRILSVEGKVLLEEFDRPWVGCWVESVFRSRKARIFEHSEIERPLALLQTRSAMAMPVVLDDKTLGVLTFATNRELSYRMADAKAVASVIGQYAVAIGNAHLVRGLEEANRIKRDIIQFASHELNTPLTVIKGFSSILAADTKGIGKDRLSELLKAVDQQADRLTRLVADLLLVSQIEAGRIDLFLSRFDLGLLVSDTCTAVWQSTFPTRGLRVEAPLGTMMRQDANRVVRCLTHLITNAFNFSLPGTEVVTTLRKERRSCEVAVFNADEGLTPDAMKRIFDEFGRMSRHKASLEGTGLGLYTTKRLANRLGGELQVESDIGKGTTFTLILPDMAAE